MKLGHVIDAQEYAGNDNLVEGNICGTDNQKLLDSYIKLTFSPNEMTFRTYPYGSHHDVMRKKIL